MAHRTGRGPRCLDRDLAGVLGCLGCGVWNNAIVGVAIFVLAGYNYYRMVNERPSLWGAMALVALLAVWTVVAPFAFDIGSDALLWSNVIAGVLAALSAAFTAQTGRRMRSGAPGPAE